VNREAAKLKKFGRNIFKHRQAKGWSQNVFAEMIDVSREHLSKVEAGMVRPSISLLFRIADTLEVTEEELFRF